MSQPELSVIIPCHNEQDTLGAQLAALLAQRWAGDWEVVVVDNNSTDATRSVATSFAGGSTPVRVVEADAGRGVAYARNAGVRATQARAVAFCDGDDRVHPGWVPAMGDALRRTELVVGPVEVESINEPWLARSRPLGSSGAVPRFGGVPFARGNNCGMTRDLWSRLGGFDEQFVGLEDIEFSLRAVASGTAPVLVPAALVAYRFRPALSDIWRQGLFYGRGRARLAAIARELGLDPPPRLAGLRSWAWLLLRVPLLVNRSGRAAWLWTLANRIGSLRGAVDTRQLFV